MWILLKVNNVTTKSYQCYYWTPKKAYIRHEYFLRSDNGLLRNAGTGWTGRGGLESSENWEVGPRSGPYLLVLIKQALSVSQDDCLRTLCISTVKSVSRLCPKT